MRTDWHLQLDNRNGKLSFTLQLAKRPEINQLQVNAKFIVQLLDNEGKVKYGKESRITVFSVGYPQPGRQIVSSYGHSASPVFQAEQIDNFITVRDLQSKGSELLSDGALRIRCELVVYGRLVHTSVHKLQVPSDLADLGRHMDSVRKEGFLTDFTLVAGEREFKVHKVVLATQSTVFRRMIETDMKESQDNCITIRDFTPEVVEELVTYLYTGMCSFPDSLEGIKEDLLRIANKYELLHLKALSEEALCEALNSENVVDTLVLADMHSADQLKSACLTFIKDRISYVLDSPGWHRLKDNEEHHELYMQLLEAQLPPPAKKLKLT